VTQRLNFAEGQTSGTTATQGSGGNTGGGSGDYFDTISGAGTPTFDSTHAAHGGNAYKIVTGGTAALCVLQWAAQLGGTPSTAFARLYVYRTANPSGASQAPARFLTSGGVQVARLAFTTAGKIIFNDAANTTQLTSTNTIPLNQWIRIECMVVCSATVGQLEFKLFSAADSTTATETKTSAASLNTTGPIGQIQYGITGATFANETYWIDDIGFSDAAYLGPSPVTGTGAPAVKHPTLAASGSEAIGGTAALAISHAVLAASGAEAIGGTAALAVKHAVLVAAGNENFAATAALTARHATLAASGGETFGGLAALTARAAVLAAVGGEFIPPRQRGTAKAGAGSLPRATAGSGGVATARTGTG
jgi:hypothetical protein